MAGGAAATFVPQLEWSKDYITVLVAVFGTTISPYLFFWQASQEVEEQRADPDAAAAHARAGAGAAPTARGSRIDTVVGMGFSNLVALLHHRHDRRDAARARHHRHPDLRAGGEALRPIAGDFAFALFALGIIGTGLLAVPVLAGSAAYAMAETFRLDEQPRGAALEARAFYAVIVVATLVGAALDFTPIDPIKALFWSAVVNGVIAVPIMA